MGLSATANIANSVGSLPTTIKPEFNSGTADKDTKISNANDEILKEAHKSLSDTNKNSKPLKSTFGTALILGGLGISLIDNLRGRLFSGPFNLIGSIMVTLGFVTSTVIPWFRPLK